MNGASSSGDPVGFERLQEFTVQRRVPTATYRWQFHSGFTFTEAAAQCDYLERLGVSACYASPLFQARPGSTHGYDVCNFNQLNPELGGEEGFERFCRSLQGCGLGLIVDMVPNHMGIGHQSNRWWWDVLQHGPCSEFAAHFDIDWFRGGPALGHEAS